MPDHRLNLDYYKGEDLYSEGEVEDRLLAMIQADQKPQDILEYENEWSFLYHLSEIRYNLIEWMDIPEGASVLEIGSGCGAITGVLCRKFRHVTCVELSEKRSTINLLRNNEYDNLEIFVANLEDIPVRKYDYVTLIGVLEYSETYLHAEFPYDEMLRKCREFLKPDGTLILAIENKFGLKYFAGAAEDHTAGYFDGIENYRTVKGVRTFSKKELTNLLAGNGFDSTRFYYPIQDYKMPKCLYSQFYLPRRGDLRGMEVCYDRDRFALFDEDSVFDELCDEGLFEQFANSFLVCAKIGEPSDDRTVLYAKYNRSRAPMYQTGTVIYEEKTKDSKGKRSRYVEKTALTDEAREHVGSLYDKAVLQAGKMTNLKVLIPEVRANAVRYPYVEGLSIEQMLQKFNFRADQLILQMKEWNRKIYAFAEDDKGNYGMIDHANIDMNYDNLILTDDGMTAIDCEWILEEKVPVKYLIYRTVYYYYIRYRKELEPQISIADFLKAFDITEEEWWAYDNREAQFQQVVQGRHYKYSYENRYVKKVTAHPLRQFHGLEQMVLSAIPENEVERQKFLAEVSEQSKRMLLDDAKDQKRKGMDLAREITKRDKDIEYLNDLVADKEQYIKNLEEFLAEIRKNPLYKVIRAMSKLSGK